MYPPECAARKGVRLLVDAEQTYMQPAIDHMALLMMQKYNTEQPYIFNTYQCYLKDAPERVNRDMERAQRLVISHPTFMISSLSNIFISFVCMHTSKHAHIRVDDTMP